MATTYRTDFFTRPHDKAAIGELQTVPYVWAGFVLRNSTKQRPQDLLGLKMPRYVSNDHQLDGGARFRVMVIEGSEIPLFLKMAENGDMALLGVREAKKWPRPSLVNMDPHNIKAMLPIFEGPHPSPSLNTVTIRDDFDGAAEAFGRWFGKGKEALRGLFHRPSPKGHVPHA